VTFEAEIFSFTTLRVAVAVLTSGSEKFPSAARRVASAVVTSGNENHVQVPRGVLPPPS